MNKRTLQNTDMDLISPDNIVHTIALVRGNNLTAIKVHGTSHEIKARVIQLVNQQTYKNKISIKHVKDQIP